MITTAIMANDLLPLEKNLSGLLTKLNKSEVDDDWQQVASAAQVLANGLRDKDGPGWFFHLLVNLPL